jgi:hypothetical protein
MWGTSPEFDAALRASTRQWRSRVDILYAGALVTALDVLMDGYVDIDDVAVRRAGKFRLVDPHGSLTPKDARDLLAPKGTELRPMRGLVLADGTVEWVPLGVLGITEPKINSLPGGGVQIELTALDRVDAVRARRFASPYRVAAGTPTHTAIANIVTSRMTVETRLQVTGYTTPELLYDALSDPWDAVRDIAASDTLSAFFDPLGTLSVVRDEPAVTKVHYEPGPESFVISTQRSLSSANTYSGVVVRVEHPDSDPITAELWDTNPSSPTYADGPFGRRPYGYSSSVITTTVQAQAVAATLLPRVSKMRQEASLETVGHPGHDVGDLVTVTDPRTGTSGRWVIKGGRVPLRPSGGNTSWKLQEAPVA